MQKITSASFFIGKDDPGLISFGSGQPDLPPPDEAFDILPTYRDFKYGLVQGMLKLRENLAKQYLDAPAESFVITNGASEALDLSLRALYVPGGKIMLPRPYYYSYPFNVEFSGMESVFYDLEKGKINFENFKSKLNGVRAIVINSPSNPTGTIQNIETLKKIEKIAKEKNIYIISDEVYKDLIYERENYLIQGDNVLTINSFSKTYAMCGFRVGYVYAREKELINKIIEIKTHTSMNTNILGQEMAIAAMRVPEIFLEDQVATWKKRRDIIYNGLKDLGLDLWKPEGAFYVFPKMKNPNKVVNDLYYKYKVMVYDGAWFGSPDRVRLSYALGEEKIVEGLKRIKDYLGKEYLEN